MPAAADVSASVRAHKSTDDTFDAPVSSALTGLIRLVDMGMVQLRAGNLDQAKSAFDEAQEIAGQTPDLNDADAFLPDIALARLAMLQEDYSAMSEHAARAATFSGATTVTARALQAEALVWQGIAAFGLERFNEADLLMRAALKSSADFPDMKEVRDTLRFHLALLSWRIGAPDAAALREDVLYEDYEPPFYVSLTEMAFLFYVDAYAARAGGAAPEDLLSYVAEMLEAFDEASGVSADVRSTLTGFYGMLLVEAGRDADALSHLQKHHDHLLEVGTLNDDFVWNAQRLAMSRRNLGDTVGAYDFLAGLLEMLDAQGFESGVFAVLEQDMGGFQAKLNHPMVAQEHYRRAYEILRQTRGVTDNDVMLLRPLIDVTAPGFDSFAFANEIAAQDAPLILAADGNDVLERFLRGDYLSAITGFARARQDETTDPMVFEINRALFFALTGEFDGAQDALAHVRSTDNGGEGLLPDAPIVDLIDALSRIWGSDHDPFGGRAALDRLLARLSELRTDQQRLVFGLYAELGFRTNDTALTARMVAAWQAMFLADAPPSPWLTLADMIGYEAASGALPVDELNKLALLVGDDIATTGDAGVAQDYVRLIQLSNGGVTITEQYLVAELGALVRRLRDRLPPQHFLNAAAEHAMSEAYQWRRESDQALGWLERATDTTRANPWHSPSVLAYLLSKQATLLGALGAVERAALMGREAYGVADFTAPRTDLLAGVVRSYASAEFALTGDAEQAAGIYKRHLDDPTYFDGLGPILQVEQLQQLASVMLNYAPWDEVRAVLDRAEAAVPMDADDTWAVWQSDLEWTRAIGAQLEGEPAEGWAAMVRSDRYNVVFNDMLRARGSAQSSDQSTAVLRAQWAAQIGWDYVQSLEN